MRSVVLAILLLAGIAARAAVPADSTRILWPLVADALGSCVVNTTLTETLKNTVSELRPNGEDNHSFPSRHTTWAFAASTFISNNTYRKTPWLAMVSHAAASGVGLQRVGSRAHWGSDVVAGAGIGILSAEISNIVCRRIFGGPGPYNPDLDNDFRPSLAVVSRAAYHLEGDIATGFATALDFRMPLHEVWGVALTAEGEAAPVKMDGRYYAPLWTFTALAGPMVHLSTPLRPIAAEFALQCGPARYCKAADWRTRTWAFAGSVSAGLSWRLSDSFAARLAADYRRTASRNTLALSLASVVLF